VCGQHTAPGLDVVCVGDPEPYDRDGLNLLNIWP
jgi:hypothetical protein